jgi:hypothetical protein
VAAAKGLVAAEQNFNPFSVKVPSICSDPTLPTTLVLRGITPLIDPAVGGSALANALSKQSLAQPFGAVGLSVADVLAAHGFTNFTTKNLAGVVETPGDGGASAAAPASVAAVTGSPAKTKCGQPPAASSSTASPGGKKKKQCGKGNGGNSMHAYPTVPSRLLMSLSHPLPHLP